MPRNVFTDRGTGMYNPAGKVVKVYAEAVDAAGVNLYWGADAGRLSPDMGDVLLHETAVAWFRNLMKKEKPERLTMARDAGTVGQTGSPCGGTYKQGLRCRRSLWRVPAKVAGCCGWQRGALAEVFAHPIRSCSPA